MNKGDFRYVDRNGNPISESVYNKYAKDNGGHIQYFDGQNWGTTPIQGGTYFDGNLLTKDVEEELNRKYGAEDTGVTSTERTPSNNIPPKNNPIIGKTNTPRQARKRAIAPDGSTQVGYTQEEFNQRLKDYEMEDQALNERRAQQANLRSQTIGNGNMTRDQIFKDALNKFATNPDGFTAEQRTALYNAGKQLGYYNDTMLDNGVQKPAQTAASVTPQNTNEPEASGAQPTIQPQSQSNNNVKQGGGSNFIWYV